MRKSKGKFIAALVPALFAIYAHTTAIVLAAPLEGSVQHSDTLSPVAPELTPGNIFNEKEMPTLDPGNLWVAIPNWMVGTWQFKTETVTHMNVFDKHKYPRVPFVLTNEFQKVFGHQKDKTGQVWDYVKAPYSYTSKLDGGLLGFERIDNVSEVVNNPEEVTRQVNGPDSVVEPASQKILSTNQKECFVRYSRFGDDSMRMDASTKIFDAVGHPTVLKISNMAATRVKPFAPIDLQDGFNLKSKFADFLTEQKKSDIIP